MGTQILIKATEWMIKAQPNLKMRNRIFQKKTLIKANVQKAFQWHEQDGAIDRLTPPWAPLKLLKRKGQGVSEGVCVWFKIKLLGISMLWKAVHFYYKKDSEFRDRQEKGPFALWEHHHRFVPVDDSAFYMEDYVEYRLPFGWLSYPFYGHANKEFERMFAYRHAVLKHDLEQIDSHKPMRILMSGASGTIGSGLTAFLKTCGHTVIHLVRNPEDVKENMVFWDPYKGVLDLDSIGQIDAVINLNGVDISRGRWTKKQKNLIIDSRVMPTVFLAEKIRLMKNPPKVFISSSAIGYYGEGKDAKLIEDHPPGQCFISEVCDLWEKASQGAAEDGIRTIQLRIGIVLTPLGGALQRMAPAFSMGAGVQLADGKQYMSWISMEDAVRAFLYMIRTPSIEGAVNLSAPHPVTNKVFGHTLGSVLGRKVFFRMPAWVARMLWGQMGKETLLTSARVLPEKLIKHGFKFTHQTLEEALKHQLGRKNSTKRENI